MHVRGWFVAACIVLQAPVSFAQSAPPDSVRRGGLLDRLQREDESHFGSDITGINRVFRDSVVAALDSLGLEQFQKQSPKRVWRLGLSFDLATRLWDYNRSEGFVYGGGLLLEPLGDAGPWLQLQGAHATGSRKFRHYSGVAIPVAPHSYLSVQARYADGVIPYGANRPTGNSVRALVGAEDPQDYLREQGGGAYVVSRPRRAVFLCAGYEASKKTGVPVTTKFALIGNMSPANDPVDEGTERAVVTGLRLGRLNSDQWETTLTHRVAGGDLAGDFTYNRTDLNFALRRYLGRQEFVLEGTWARTGGNVPIQNAADLGGVAMVRGFQRRSQVGTSAFHARLEYLVPYDFLRAAGIPILRRARLQLVPWADAGRTWGGPTHVWIQSAGFGVQYFMGPFGNASFLRLDTAFPMGPDRTQDVRVELRFAAGFF